MKHGLKERIGLIVKSPKTAIPVLFAILIIVAVLHLQARKMI
jgi:hypothetical protein